MTNGPQRIESDRLVLRRAGAADAQALHGIFCDPSAMRYWSTGPHRDLAETEAWLESMRGAPQATSDDFIVEAGGRVIGKFGAWRLPEIGFIFDRQVWGRGYALEAGRAFLRHADAMGLGPLTADVDPRNAASIRLLGRLGFAETGRAERTFCIDGQWSDSMYFSRGHGAAEP